MLHDTGEEFLLDEHFEESATKPASLTIGLYNDATDGLAEANDIGDITTEPQGGSYARQTVTYGSDFNNSDLNGNWQSIIADKVFDTSDSSQDVDSFFVVVTFQSDDKGDGSANDHLFFTGSLDQTYDLSQIDQLTISGQGVELS